MQAELIIGEFSCLYSTDTIVRRCTAVSLYQVRLPMRVIHASQQGGLP